MILASATGVILASATVGAVCFGGWGLSLVRERKDVCQDEETGVEWVKDVALLVTLAIVSYSARAKVDRLHRRVV